MDTSDLTDLLSTAFDEAVYIPAPVADWELVPAEDLRPTPHARPPVNLWDPRLILDLAIGIDEITTILPRYDLTEAEFNLLSETPVFRRELAMAMREARENGLPFANKAKFQAESYLEVLDELVYSAETPASVRLEAIRSTVKWARLEQPTGAEAQGNAPQINVSISF
jgi:hypothetical protein